MRIVHVTSFFQPGMGYQENCLAPAQARLGHEVSIITSDRMPSEAALMGDPRTTGRAREEVDGVTVIRLRSLWQWHAHNWVYLKGLWAEIKALDPDIIHAHNIVTIPTWQVLSGNRQRRYPLVLDDHNNYFNIQPYTFQKKVFYGMFRRLLRPLWIGSVGRVMPMSHEVQRLVRTEFGIDDRLITLVHLGADPERFKRNVERGAAVRARLGISPSAVVIVNAGKITRHKDNHVLLEAMSEVVKRDPRAHLLMIGDAPPEYRAELEGVIARCGIAAKVAWIAFAENAELSSFYSAAGIGVWPGDWSITVLEAASCELPLVLPDREYALYSVGNENGILFERGSAHALAEALTALVSDDVRRGAMGRRSRELIEKKLNWDAIARETINVYQEVITGRGGKPHR
jgi:glycosyltransferase involved in cell wall biosynthesis